MKNNLFKTVNQYSNNAPRPYESSDSEDVLQVLDMVGKPQREFDMKREKNLSNRVFSKGQQGIDHRKKEKEAKNKRLGKDKKEAKPRNGPKN